MKLLITLEGEEATTFTTEFTLADSGTAVLLYSDSEAFPVKAACSCSFSPNLFQIYRIYYYLIIRT